MYRDRFQRWDVWADSGYVDALEHMLYLSDSHFPAQLTEAIQLVPPGFLLYPGISYDYEYVEGTSVQFQINCAREKGVKGVSLWYYGDMTDSTLIMLRNDIFQEPTGLPHNDVIVDNSASFQFQFNGNWEQRSGGYQGNYLISDPGEGSTTAIWYPNLVKTAKYDIFARWTSDAGNAAACYKIIKDTEEKSVIVDQRQNSDRWVFLLSDTISYDEPVSIQLSSNADGKVVADAVRLVVAKEFDLMDLNVPDSLCLELKFNRNLDKETAENISCYAVDGNIDVVSAVLNDNDPTIVTLTTTLLTPNYQYSLDIAGLQDENRRVLPSIQTEFSYIPQETHVLIDNGERNFYFYGNWIACSDGDGYLGDDYLVSTAGNGENRAQWWHFIEMDGYYEIAVKLPAGVSSAANEVSYDIMHCFGTDVVCVDQRVDDESWKVLGRFYFRAGKVASVKVTNDVSQGVVIADAVRIRRVLTFSDVESHAEDFVPASYRIYQNYPNPFNPSTTIEFEIPVSGKVILEVFSLLGQKVETMVARELQAGRHQFRFDGSNIASGVYFYRWSYFPEGRNIRPVIATKKMLLLH